MSAQHIEQEGVAYFRVGGHSFRCSERVSFWLVAKVSHLEAKGADDAEMLPVVYRLVMSIIHPDEHVRADAVLGEMSDLTPQELGDAVRAAFAEMGALPKASASPSPHGSASPGTPTTSRVVSFSRGTVEEVPIGVETETSTPTASSTD